MQSSYCAQPGTYAAEFDPYGSFGGIPNSFDQRQQRQPSPSPQSRLQPPHSSTPSLNSTAHPTSYNAHPRKVVENNKQALESWNESAWQTFLKRVSELREAWEKRKASILHALENQRGRQLQYDEQQRFQKVCFNLSMSDIFALIGLTPLCRPCSYSRKLKIILTSW